MSLDTRKGGKYEKIAQTPSPQVQQPHPLHPTAGKRHGDTPGTHPGARLPPV